MCSLVVRDVFAVAPGSEGGLRVHLGVLIMLSGGGRESLGVFGGSGLGLRGIWDGSRGVSGDHSVTRGG